MMKLIFSSFLNLALVAGTYSFSPMASAEATEEKQIEKLSNPIQAGQALEFEKILEANLQKVEEFRFIRQWAQKKGVPAYLFGGAATAFGVYSRWNKEHAEGLRRFSDERFDFKVSNIFHFNQDVDVLIDASVELAAELQNELDTHFPYQKTTGGKTISIWEIRPLRHAIGLKPKVIGNTDFQNQNTDSNSTGLIEITDPKEGISRVQDLRSFRPEEGRFLHDLMEGRISYYNTALHNKTSRATAANPITISALRFLIKLYEYDLVTDRESLKNALTILKKTNFPQIKSVRGSMRWIEKNGPKLLDNAVDVEKAWLLLKQMDLLKELSIFGPAEDQTSVAWLMKRKPLMSYPISESVPEGQKTSGSLGITQGYLRLDSFKDFERLRMGAIYSPNLLSDKARVKLTLTPNKKPGEIWVGFNIHPHSILGTDFEMLGTDGLRVRNRNSLRLIPETLHIPREMLLDLIYKGADPDFVAFVIRQYNLLATLTEAEYLPIKKFMEASSKPDDEETENQQSVYSALLLPLIIKFENREKFSSPERFIGYIHRLLDEGSMKKSEIAQVVMSNIDDFFKMNPTYDQAMHMKSLVRHGPQFVAYMTRLMQMYAKTSGDYMKLLAYNEEEPSESYLKRTSYFIESSFKKFLELQPSNREIKSALDQLLPDAREKVIQENGSTLKELIGKNKCDRYLNP